MAGFTLPSNEKKADLLYIIRYFYRALMSFMSYSAELSSMGSIGSKSVSKNT